MSGGRGWQVATFVLGATTLALGGLLAVQPEPVSAPTPSVPAEPPAADDAEPRERTRVEGETVEASPSVDELERAPDSAGPTRKSALRPEFVKRLDAMDVREAALRLARPTIDGARPFAREEVMERLRREPQAAAAVLEDWLRRRKQLRAADVPLAVAGLVSAYVELRGAEASAFVQRLYFDERERQVLVALVRLDDPAVLPRIDAHNRAAAKVQIAPDLVWTAGEEGRALVRTWAFDASVTGDLRQFARMTLWRMGDDADRDRVLAATPDVDALEFATTPMGRWASAHAQLSALAGRLLEESDPWQRLHAERRLLRLRYVHDERLVARAAERARVDAELPNPGGRPPDRWEALRNDVRKHVQQRDEEREKRRRLRELLEAPVPGK